MTSPSKNAMYRPDIDGLRAVAVLAVIIYHFNETILPSGYLGVDIFFAISGFVITASLIDQAQCTGIRQFLLLFYERRIKRIVPALVLSTLIGGIGISLFDNSPDASLKTGIAAQFGASNVYLLRASWDYFADSSVYNAFLNTWSLGVEEQFYFVFPVIIWLGLWFSNTWQQRTNDLNHIALRTDVKKISSMTLFIIFLSIVSLASFSLFVTGHLYRPTYAFYSMPTRFWELSTGALAYFATRAGFTLSARQHGRIANLALGTILVVLTLAPATAAIISTPTVICLNCTLLLAENQQSSSYRLLSHVLWTSIGRLSYSLYLYHWPVIIIAKITCGISPFTAPFLICTILLFSLISFRLVETPMRHGRWSGSATVTVLLGILGVVVTAGFLFVLLKPLHNKLYLGQLPQMEQIGVSTLITPYQLKDGVWRGDPCVLSDNSQVGKIVKINDCTLGQFDDAKKRTLVVGNSFSAALTHAFDSLVEIDRYAVTITSTFGASPVPELQNSGRWSKLNDYYWRTVVPHLTSQLRRGDMLFLVNDMAGFYTAGSIATPDEIERIETLETGLRKLSLEMSSLGVNLSILHGLPLAREAQCTPEQAYSQWFNQVNLNRCHFHSREETLKRRDALDTMLRRLEADGVLRIVDLFDVFCPSYTCTFQASDGEMLYRDIFSHPSVEAARLSGPEIRTVLSK